MHGDRPDTQDRNARGKYFNSTGAFDKHRTGAYGIDRRCMATEEMTAAGMATNAGGYWIATAFEEFDR